MAKLEALSIENESNEKANNEKENVNQRSDNKRIAVVDSKLPTTASSKAVDPFEAYANEVAPQNIIGELMKFNKGDILRGKDGKVVPAGSIFTAGMDLMAVGFIKWRGGRPVDQVLVRLGDGNPRPRREDLGDHNEDEWEIDLDGEPKNPWQAVNYLPLLDDQGALCTFAVSGVSAIKEAGRLSGAYASHRKTRPYDFPRIRLDVGSYVHRNRSIGRVKFPAINCIGWTPKIDFMKALADIGMAPDEVVTKMLTEPAMPPDDEEPPPITELPPDRDNENDY